MQLNESMQCDEGKNEEENEAADDMVDGDKSLEVVKESDKGNYYDESKLDVTRSLVDQLRSVEESIRVEGDSNERDGVSTIEMKLEKIVNTTKETISDDRSMVHAFSGLLGKSMVEIIVWQEYKNLQN